MTTRLWRFIVDHFLLLPIGGAVALAWANLAPESYFTTARTLAFPVNEIGMALFLALITQEIVEETLPHGALHSWRKWTLPLVAAAGAAAGSALVYVGWVAWSHELVLVEGWPVAAAVDLAFTYFIVKAIFPRHPALPFAIVLAVAVDVLATAHVASRQSFVDVRPGGALLMAAALGLAALLRHWKARTFWPYLLLCGPLSWWALHLDGFHPALALVPLVPFFPHKPRSLELFVDRPHGPHDTPAMFEHVWLHPIQAVLFLFGFVNAGVLLSGYGTGTWALLAAALVGKPLGIVAATSLAVAAGLHLPARFHWRDLVVVALATSGVFTFGLFFATGAYPIGPLLAELKLGAVLTGIGAPLAFAAAWLLRAGRFSGGRTMTRTRHAVARGAAALLLCAALAAPAAAQQVLTDEDIAADVAQHVQRYVFFTIFDDVDVQVDHGVVTLAGRVTMPYKVEALGELAARVDGVEAVQNEIRTLPVSQFDDDLRYGIARRLYGDPLFWHAAIQVNPPIHIVVERGAVTLTGVVLSEVERRVAETIARSSLAFSVTNKLRVEIED
ncbi:MAG: BON domain-containing protein [Acidimicrobiia bacterium]|nr:BON domain-containing protein [Acidimicrobiia bacterium]